MNVRADTFVCIFRQFIHKPLNCDNHNQVNNAIELFQVYNFAFSIAMNVWIVNIHVLMQLHHIKYCSWLGDNSKLERKNTAHNFWMINCNISFLLFSFCFCLFLLLPVLWVKSRITLKPETVIYLIQVNARTHTHKCRFDRTYNIEKKNK